MFFIFFLYKNFDTYPKFIQKFTFVVCRYQMCSSSEFLFFKIFIFCPHFDFVLRNFIYIPNMA